MKWAWRGQNTSNTVLQENGAQNDNVSKLLSLIVAPIETLVLILLSKGNGNKYSKKTFTVIHKCILVKVKFGSSAFSKLSVCQQWRFDPSLEKEPFNYSRGTCLVIYGCNQNLQRQNWWLRFITYYVYMPKLLLAAHCILILYRHITYSPFFITDGFIVYKAI